jgi:hypothetical protein
MALSYNSATRNDSTYPRSLFSARYYNNDTTIRLERRRSGGATNFAAWVQGIDFAGVGSSQSVACANTPETCYEPDTNPAVVSEPQYVIPAGSTLTLTYQAVVDANPSPSLAAIVNTATVSTAQNPTPRSRTISDALRNPRVDVEPNNAGYASAGQPIVFTHAVRNGGNQADSYALVVLGEAARPWPVDLIDPDTGVVIATDNTGAGTWDSGTPPNTGSLAPGAAKEYQLRVWVPDDATTGLQTTVRLRATSATIAATWDDAKDEITVLPATSFGNVVVTPDNSGVVQAGGFTAYAHRVVNVTGSADTFDLVVDSSRRLVDPAWRVTIHWDTNGDGVYTPAIDVPIQNTSQLPDGGSQLVFVVVSDHTGSAAGTRDVSHITATSRNDPTRFGAATDTSTVVRAQVHDLSGGGSRVVAPDDTAVHPGTIVNLGSTPDRFELSLTAASLFGPEGDGLPHPTELWVDSDADGVADVRAAADTNGDGSWDLAPVAAWDQDGDGVPDVPVAANGSFAYELRRKVNASQKVQRDFVTLQSRSLGNPSSDPDNVTATWIFAALTRAGIGGLRVGPGEVVFATSTQAGTTSFLLYETDDPTGASGREALHMEPVRTPLPDSTTPIVYRVATRAVTKPFLMIEERERDGDVVWSGPFAAGDARLARALGRIERRMDDAGVPEGDVRWLRGGRASRALLPGRGGARGTTGKAWQAQGGRARGPVAPQRSSGSGVKIVVEQPGTVDVPAAQLAPFGLVAAGPLAPLTLTSLGAPVPFAWAPDPAGGWRLRFLAQGLRSDYSGGNVYVLSRATQAPRASVPLSRSAEAPRPGFRRVEREVLYVPSLPASADVWQWDALFPGQPWPDPSFDPTAGDFDLPGLAPGATGPVELRVRLVGHTTDRHSFTVSINGQPVGSLSIEGAGPALLVGTVPAESLRATGNTLAIEYQAAALGDGEPLAYLDYVDIQLPAPTAGPAAFALEPWSPTLPSLAAVEYLVVTHPLFRAQADRIAAVHAGAGRKAAVVETSTAYDRHAAGFVEPRAIQALVREAARASAVLSHVLLVGDDSFDPLDHSGRGVPSFLPSLFARDSSWGWVPSENLYADLDDDGAPDLAIGRLPVRTVADAEAAADKIAAAATSLGELGETHLAVADNSTETDTPFLDDALEALSSLPAGARIDWADVGGGPALARAQLLAGWQRGVLGTHYFGHGGLTEWADEQVLTAEDVAASGGDWKPTVLFTWACLAQYFLGVDGPALNEALVLQPGGGALASFGPAGITAPANQAPLAARLYEELRTPGTTLGEAVMRAKRRALAERALAREVVDGFNLLGDPALVLPRGPELPQ